MRDILIGPRLALCGYRIRLPIGLRMALFDYHGARLIRLLRDGKRIRRAIQDELFTIHWKTLVEFTVIRESWRRQPWHYEFDDDELRSLYAYYTGDQKGHKNGLAKIQEHGPGGQKRDLVRGTVRGYAGSGKVP